MRAKRSILTYFTQSTSSIILMILSFCATPFILDAVGKTVYGQYRLLLEYIGYFGLLEFGLYSTTRILISESLTQSKEKVLSVIKYSFIQFIITSLISLISLWTLYYFKAYISQINQISDDQLLPIALYISLIFTLLPITTLKAKMEAEQKGYLTETASFINKALNILLIIIFIFIKIELHTFFLVLFISHLASHIFIFFKSDISLSDIFKPQLSVKKGTTRSDIFLFDLAGKINLSSDSIILSWFINIEMVTIFYLSQRLVGIVSSFIFGISNALWPALSNMYFNKEWDNLRKQILFSTRLSSYVALFFLIPILYLNSPFISLWVGKEFQAGTTFNIIIVLNCFIQSLMSLWGWLISSTNNTQLARKNLILSTISNLTLSIVFTKVFGLIGPILGTLVTSISITLIINIFILRKLFNITVKELLRSSTPSFIYLLINIILYYFFFPHGAILSPFNFIFSGFFITFSSALISFYLLLDATDRTYLINKLGSLRDR